MKPLFIKIIAILSIGTFICCVPGYALKTRATHSSPVLAELRSELRSDAAVYDYQGIRDTQLGGLIEEQEKKIRTVLKRDFKILFSGIDVNKTGNREVSALRRLLREDPIHEYVEAADRDSERGVTLPEIKDNPEEANKIDFRNLNKHPWLEKLKIQPTRIHIKSIVFFQEIKDDTFHSFEVDGRTYKAPVRVPLWTFADGVLAINVDYLASDPSIFSYEMQSVLYTPRLLFHYDIVSPLPRVRSDAGLAYSYETIEDESLKNRVRSEELEIRKVLISGLSRLLVREFYLQSFQGVMRSILYGVVMERLSVDKGIQKIKGMIASDFDEDSYEEKINNIGEILQSDWETFVKDVTGFKVYVSGSGSDTDRKRRNRHFFNKFLEGLPTRDFFKAPSVFVKERVTIPVMKLTPQDIVDHGKTLDLENLWRQKERETIKALLFYEEPDDDDSLTGFPYLQVRVEGKIYTVPKGVPLWTFPGGVLAVNITDIEYKVKSVYQALEMALRRKPGRSELRFAGIASEHLELPAIPAVSAAKVLGARSAFGIQGQDAFVIDASLIRNSYDMALLLTVFSPAPFVVLIENTDSEQAKLIRAVNRKLPDTGRIPMAASIDEALLLLNKQKAALMRKPDTSRTNYSQTRILLSDQFSSDAAALKRQIGDHAIVKVFSLDQFSKIAFGIVNRLGLSDFAAQLQDKIFAQLRTSRSA